MKVVFTKHVEDKLQEEDSLKLEITSKKIINIIKNPLTFDEKSGTTHSIGEFNANLSLSIIWKIEKSIIKVITFYPARKGRYESKILQRRRPIKH